MKIPFSHNRVPARTFIYLLLKIFTRVCLDLFILPEQDDHQKDRRAFEQHDEAAHQLARQMWHQDMGRRQADNALISAEQGPYRKDELDQRRQAH